MLTKFLHVSPQEKSTIPPHRRVIYSHTVYTAADVVEYKRFVKRTSLNSNTITPNIAPASLLTHESLYT